MCRSAGRLKCAVGLAAVLFRGQQCRGKFHFLWASAGVRDAKHNSETNQLTTHHPAFSQHMDSDQISASDSKWWVTPLKNHGSGKQEQGWSTCCGVIRGWQIRIALDQGTEPGPALPTSGNMGQVLQGADDCAGCPYCCSCYHPHQSPDW